MNSLTSHVESPSAAWRWWKSRLWEACAVLVGGALLTFLILAGQVRAAVALAVGGVLVALAAVRIQAAVFAALVFLVFMGDLRRLLIPWVGWSGTDPLLLIGPAFALVLFGYALVSGAVRLDTPMAKWTAALMVVMGLQVFNPRQGGLMVGAAGGLFFVIPLLWYWIGRTYATPAFMETLLYKGVVPLAVVAALMGYYQTFYGYLPYQQQWYDIAGYTALGSEGIQAPISLFSSSTEYAVFLLIGMVAVWAQVLKRRRYALLGLVAFLFGAVFLVGSRGPVAKFLITAAGLWAVLGRSVHTWVVRGAVALVIGVLGLVWGLSSVDVSGADARVQHRVSRQVEGLAGAAEEGSSARGHLGMMIHGYKEGLQSPLGQGLGATTKAAAKFGGQGGSLEVDSSDVFRSTGLVGGVIYLIIMFLIIRGAVQYWTRTRGLLALALAGILAVTFFGWLRGGRYAVAPVIWICVGALDRAQKKTAQRDKTQHNSSRPPVPAREPRTA
jgi:hypothetical protein